MFCIAVRNQIAPENIEKFCDIIKNQRNPLAARQKGFKGTYLMVNADV